MGLYTDFLALIGGVLRIFLGHSELSPLVFVIALLLAGCCWWAATHYSSLWNLRFQTTFKHQCLCLLTAFCTLIFTIVFVSMQYTKQAADSAIDRWSVQLVHDRARSQATFEATYKAVRALGLEDPAHLQQMWEQKKEISITRPESRKKFATVYANAAVTHFYSDHPFLSKVLGPRADIPADFIDQKVNEFFRLNPGETFNAHNAVSIAATKIKDGLQGQTDRLISVVRIILLALFIVAQLIPFSLIGYAAYTDLKVVT